MNEIKNITYHAKLLKPLIGNLPGTSAKSKVLLWQFLKEQQMHGYHFNRQMPIGNCILDFFCYELLLGIVLDGHAVSNDAENKINEDQLLELGLQIIHFDDKEILYDINKVLAIIEGYVIKYENIHRYPHNYKLKL